MKRFSFTAALALAATLGPVASPALAQQVVALRPAGLSRDIALATFDSAWSRINATHYDSTFSGVDWQAVRNELRPRAASAGSVGELRGVIRDMLERLGESHYTLIPLETADAISPAGDDASDASDASGHPGDLGMELRLVEGRMAVWRLDRDGPAAAAGIRTGWTVESVDGYDPAGAIEKLDDTESLAARRNVLTRLLWGANAQLDGRAGRTAAFVFLDGAGRRVEKTVVRRPRPGQPIRFGELPTFYAELDHERIAVDGGCVGVIRFNVWMVPLVRQFDAAVDAVRDCTGIVIDLRGNPGGVAGMVMGVSGHFLDAPATLGTMRSRGSSLNFVANPRRVDTSARPVQPFAGPVAILIDPMSVSTTEIFAAGMQTLGRARIFGETSAGQALPAATLRLPDGDVLMHVVADFTAGNGVRIEGRGVVPDEAAPPTREALLAGHDTALDAAIRWIRIRPHSH